MEEEEIEDDEYDNIENEEEEKPV